jgi:SAM-dependent methyltransferase
MAFKEVVVRERIEKLSNLDPAGYIAANLDLQEAGVNPTFHFEMSGKYEERYQYKVSEIREIRTAKLALLDFNREPVLNSSVGEALTFLSSKQIEEFDIPALPPICQNEYNEDVQKIVKQNGDKKLLDIGSGLRWTYYSNVVNTEIWPSVTADVVCVAEDLPFSSDQFDGVICLAVLEHTMNPFLAISEIIRVLKPGGFAYIDWPFLQAVHGYPHHYYNATPQGAINAFNKACDIIWSKVDLSQHPSFVLHTVLRTWRDGLPNDLRRQFESMKVSDFIDMSPLSVAVSAVGAAVSPEVQSEIASGSTLFVRKR